MLPAIQTYKITSTWKNPLNSAENVSIVKMITACLNIGSSTQYLLYSLESQAFVYVRRKTTHNLLRDSRRRRSEETDRRRSRAQALISGSMFLGRPLKNKRLESAKSVFLFTRLCRLTKWSLLLTEELWKWLTVAPVLREITWDSPSSIDWSGTDHLSFLWWPHSVIDNF